MYAYLASLALSCFCCFLTGFCQGNFLHEALILQSLPQALLLGEPDVRQLAGTGHHECILIEQVYWLRS